MLNPNLNIFFSIILLLLPRLVVPEEKFVYEYGSDDFKKHIQEKEGNFVMFYTTWCRHCTNFHPIWNELAEMVNTQDSNFAIAAVDCTEHSKLCNDVGVTGYPSLMYFHKNSMMPVLYRGTRDLPSLTLFLSDVFSMKATVEEVLSDPTEVKTYGGVSYLTDQNIENFIIKGQVFIFFYVPWCKASQNLAPIWAELGAHYAHNPYIKIGKVNCHENQAACDLFDVRQHPYLLWLVNGRIVGVTSAVTLQDLQVYVETMLLAENHDPDKFLKKKKSLPVARISEENFDAFLQKDLVFINYFAPWCAYCMQLSPLWMQLGEKFLNESRVIIADVDCQRSKTVCEMEKITSLPTLVLYKKNKVVSSENGGKPLETLVAMVTEQLDTITGQEENHEESEATILEKAAKDEL